jgi:baculoviral IAP repeat-containing protein 6
LSLLGTWGGQSASERWIPPNAEGTGSTLFQVIMSIYSMVFSEDPWFNEPGRERSIDKAEANVTANDYNKQIQDATIKYAIINQLKYPEEGFEDVIKAHFELKKDKISAYLLSLDKKVEDVIFNGLLL